MGIFLGFLIALIVVYVTLVIWEWFEYRNADWKDQVLELSGPEGFNMKDLRATGITDDKVYRSEPDGTPVHLYVKVIGLRDDIAPKRNWGRVTLKE